MRLSFPCHRKFPAFLSLAALLGALLTPAMAQSRGPAEKAPTAQGARPFGLGRYEKAPAAIAKVLEHPAFGRSISLDSLLPDGRHFLLQRSGGLTPLSVMSRPYVILGEMAFDHLSDRSRSLSVGNTIGYELFDVRSKKRRKLETPRGMTVASPVPSPDGRWLAFLANDRSGSWIYVADLKSGKSRRVTRRKVLATLVTRMVWTWDSKKLCTVLVPAKRKARPRAPSTAKQPLMRRNVRGKTPTRTYRFLLETPHDMALLEWLCTGQLALVDIGSGKIREIGRPAMFRSIDVAPNNRYFRVSTMQKPFSFLVPGFRFGSKQELWNLSGKSIAMLSERKLSEGASSSSMFRRGSSATKDGKRSLSWSPDGRGLSFLKLEPEKKGKKTKKSGAGKGSKPAAAKKPPRKDRVMLWKPPYGEKDVETIYTSEDPILSVRYSRDAQTLFLTTRKDGKSRLFAVERRDPKTQYLIRESQGRSSTPTPRRGRRRGPAGASRLLMTRGSGNSSVVRQSRDRGSVYLQGSERTGADKKGPRVSFVDRFVLRTKAKGRVYTSNPKYAESIRAILDDELDSLVISREARDLIPDSWLVDTRKGQLTQLTHNIDPAPEVTAATRLRFQVTRVDGFRFWVRVTIPRLAGKKLPALFWFYPREYTSQKSYDAGQSFQNLNRFPRVRSTSKELLTLLGYVVVQPDCPIVGEKGRMNDNYVADLRNSLWAVIDELDKREIIDRDRLAIGGHSYGAFGAANALAHTPFFKAGIAGDGNYNRSLTPMGFQAERRQIWQAREVYFRMSPLLWADQVQGALLMYHGQDDTNTGTFPIHAPRMFQALNGLGKPVELYMYPYEAHGPRGRETIHDLWARWVSFLDRWVKDPVQSRGKRIAPDKRTPKRAKPVAPKKKAAATKPGKKTKKSKAPRSRKKRKRIVGVGEPTKARRRIL